MSHSLRSIGSAAMNFAMVASGQQDIYWCVVPEITVCPNFGNINDIQLQIGRLGVGKPIYAFSMTSTDTNPGPGTLRYGLERLSCI